jgi:hypothetical protein
MPLPRALLFGLAALASLLACDAATLTGPACRSAAAWRAPTLAARPAVLRRLRGGADDEDEDEDELDEDEAELDAELQGGADEDSDGAEAESSRGNPFLAGAGGGLGGGASELGMEEMRKSLEDPAALQKALKELQDPAMQERFRQMLENPAFLESMKAYAEQLAKDPMFEQLKEQAEKMM